MDDTEIGEFEEARGPHLPDVTKQVPWLAWLFIGLAVAYVVWFIGNAARDVSLSLGDVPTFALRLASPVVAILLPAALLIRHPDAPTRARTLFVGTVLYAALQAMDVLESTLQPFFAAATPPPEELPGLVPLAAVYSVVTGLVGAFGLAYIALGLSRARRYEDAGSDRTAVFVAIAAVLATVAGVISVTRIDFGEIAMSPLLILYLGSAVVLGVIRVAVWAALLAVAVRGWRAGEEPVTAWLLAAVATALVLLGFVVVNVASVVGINDESVQTIYGYAVSAVFAAGSLCLLAAFLLGLPALDDADDIEDDDDEADDEAFDDDEDVLDEGGWPIATDSAS